MLVRLQKYMAECGVGARRKCEALIADGRVRVDGAVVTEMGIKVEPGVNVVEVDGRRISVPEKVYIVLNKPVGVITSADDQFGRQTVLDLVDVNTRVFPVGRLDYDTSGLIFLTNDGDFAYKLTHPKHIIEKTYLVTADGRLTQSAINSLREGVLLDDGPTLPAKVERAGTSDNKLLITITEGRNRQVRRMLEAVGYGVTALCRLSVGGVGLGELKTGEYRLLSDDEVRSFCSEVSV